MMSIFFFNDTATTEIYALSLHDALPISAPPGGAGRTAGPLAVLTGSLPRDAPLLARSSLTGFRPCPLTSPRRGPARRAGRGRRRPAGPRRPPGAAPGRCPAMTPSAPPPSPARTAAAARRG